jgi:chitin synthase
MALGDKPINQAFSYTVSFLICGFIQVCFGLIVVYLLIHNFRAGIAGNTGGDYMYIPNFYSSLGTLTVIKTCALVFGVYCTVSFLRLDPWHMIFSYPQYLFVASSYINILNVYAFSN